MIIARTPLGTIRTVTLFVTVFAALSGSAQERRTMDEGFDPRMGFTFQDSTSSTLFKTTSPNGQLQAETGFREIRVTSAEDSRPLQEFATSGHTVSPLFSHDGTALIAAVCRGNLGCISTVYSWDLKTGTRTRVGECSGTVTDISADEESRRIAVTTDYGHLFSFLHANRTGKYYGGELVIFDLDKPNESVRVFCELSGIPDASQIGDNSMKQSERNAKLKSFYVEASRNCLPIRVGVTADGSKVIGVTSTGVARVFDAETGEPELTISKKSRVDSGNPAAEKTK